MKKIKEHRTCLFCGVEIAPLIRMCEACWQKLFGTK